MTAPVEKLAYRPASAAEALDVSKATLWRLVASGAIATVKRDGCTWILRSELERFLSRLSDAA